MDLTPVGRLAFNPNAEQWKKEMTLAGGYTCKRPYPYFFEGQPRFRACGECEGCIAVQKSDHVARLGAQGFLSSLVAFVTLTYGTLEPFPQDGRPWVQERCPERVRGAQEFVTEHTAKMLRAIRQELFYLTCDRLGFTVRQVRRDPELWARVRADTPTVVFDRWGETGPNGTRRKHWHILLFFSGNMDFGSAGPFIKNGPIGHGGKTLAEEWKFWPHGNTVVKVAKNQADCVSFARYCGKYIAKGRGLSRADRKAGMKPLSVHSGSRGYALGARYFEEEARRTADAGLPLKGLFYVPGVLFSHGRHKSGYSQKQRKRVSASSTFDVVDRAGNKLYSEPLPARPGYTTVRVYGAVRDHAIAAYKDRWREKRPDVLMPLTPFLERYDKDFCFEEYTARNVVTAHKWLPRPSSLLTPLAPYRDAAREGSALVYDARGKVFGFIRVYDSGAARCSMDCGEEFWLDAGDLSLTLGRFIGQVQRQEIELWLSRLRGPFWLPKNDRVYESHRRSYAARAAIKRLSDRHENADRVDEFGAEIRGEITALARKLILNGSAYEQWLAMGKDVSDSDRAAKRAEVAAWVAREAQRDLTPEYTQSLLARLVGGTCDSREFARRSKVFRNRWNRLERKNQAQGCVGLNVRAFPKPPNIAQGVTGMQSNGSTETTSQ